MAKNGSDKAAGVTVSISAHPRAKAGIRRARTRAAFGAFMLVLALNLVGDQDLFDALWRALLAGIVVNVIVWRGAIVVWRHIILAELRQAEERRAERRREAQEQLEAQAAEQAGFRTA
jgi:hypothetical protein